ncbi:MAG: hypothetical protein RLZZ230_713 [Candidatus Parcubacteria bacterium]|jgi:hypothetical protein
MKKIYIISGIILLIGVGFLVYSKVINPYLDSRTVTAVVPTTIENTDMDFAFTYPSGEEGYTVIEPPIATTSTDGIKKIYLILNTAEYITFQTADAGGEAPPLISIFVIDLPEVADDIEAPDKITVLRTWAEQNPQLSSYSFRTSEPEEIEIDGVKALRYRTDGSYKQEVYLASHKGRVYVLTGQYQDEPDSIRAIFTNLIASLTFY